MIKLAFDEQNNNYYFIDEKGNKSEPYASAQPYSNGYALVQKEKGKGYYFRNEAGKLSQKFNDATQFDSFGFATVKRTKNSAWQYIDTNLKINEDTFYFADSYHEGLARVQEQRGGKFRFRDLNGNLSQDSYGDASRYQDGLACVSEKYLSPGKHWYRDLDGNLSEPFRVAQNYRDGFAVVGLLDEPGKFRIRDKNGNISQDSYHTIDNGCYSFGKVPTGFFKVQLTEKSPEQYRDHLGNLSSQPTAKGSDFYLYMRDRKSVFNLDTTCFGDDAFLNIIMNKEQGLLLQASEHCQNEEDMKKLAELAEYTGEFIRDAAYEAYLLLQEEQKKQEFENKRKELQSQIGKMF